MLTIPEHLLAILKCCDCKKLISTSPIYSKRNAENVCGKCSSSTSRSKQLLRNHLFEELSIHLLFPCKYNAQGCQTESKWGELENHEDNCKFGKSLIKCPSTFTDNCKWLGCYDDLIKHFESVHSNCIVKHPYEIKAYENWIKKDMKKLLKISYKNLIMEAHGFIFLLQFKVCFLSDSLWIRISFLGDSKLSVLFDTSIELFNTEPNLIHIIYVQNSNTKEWNEQNALKIELYKNFKLTIHRKAVKCANCNKIYKTISHTTTTYCCDNFSFIRCKVPKRLVQRCYFYNLGCSFIDIPENIPKHSTMLCKFPPMSCSQCFIKLTKQKMTLFDHLRTHLNTTFENNFTIIREENIPCYSKAVWKTEKAMFIIKWGTVNFETRFDFPLSVFNRGQIKFVIHAVSNILTSKEHNLDIRIKYVELLTGQSCTAVLKHGDVQFDENCHYDWYAEFPLEIFNIFNTRTMYKLSVCLLKT